MGMRLRLKSGYDTSQLTGAAKVIAEALKRYGFIVADNGSNWFFQGTSDRRWNDDNLGQLKEIPGLGVRGRALAGRDPRLLTTSRGNRQASLGLRPSSRQPTTEVSNER